MLQFRYFKDKLLLIIYLKSCSSVGIGAHLNMTVKEIKEYVLLCVSNIELLHPGGIYVSFNHVICELGHIQAIKYILLQIAFTLMVYPALILAYMGQAAYLSKNHVSSYQISYYVSVPGTICQLL